jgi:acyl-CoA reductase-like NAD-dependent aldehyde dehydrogenase
MTTTTSVLPPGKLFINGQWRDAASGKAFPVINPATEEVLLTVAEGDAVDIEEAVQAAKGAFEAGPWSTLPPLERARVLWRIGDLIMKYADDIARLETLNNGKPFFESRNIDIPLAAEFFHYFAGWTNKLMGETIPAKTNTFNYTLREPLGVVGAIVPWNFPLIMASNKVAAALAMGNTVVLKPAEQTPLTALRLAELAKEAGLPDGCLNVVPGFGPTAGAALVKHPDVAKVAFTGETRTGQEIMRNAAATLKPLSLELGGKSPQVVLADADLDAAVRGVNTGIFYGKGEVCSAGSRLLIEEKVHEQFMTKFLERTKTMKVGDPFDRSTRVGALVSREQMEKVLTYVESGKHDGAKLLVGGNRVDIGSGKGYFVAPTIFDEVRPEMKIAQEEIFGPVLATIAVKDLDDAIAKANQTMYGLAAGVWTKDIKKAHYLAKKLKAGTVWINTYNLYDVAVPFGGYKMSGFGREHGLHGVQEFTQVKSVWVDLNL